MYIFLKIMVVFIGLVAKQCTAATIDDPCDPPPPCLNAMEQNFGLSIIWKKKNNDEPIPFRILADPDPGSNINQNITVTPLPQKSLYRIEFLDPRQMTWLDKDHFDAYLDAGAGILDTLHISVIRLRIDCCPQLGIKAIILNRKTICQTCYQNQPVRMNFSN